MGGYELDLLGKDWDQWWGFMNIKDLWVLQKAGDFFTSWALINFSKAVMPLGASWLRLWKLMY